MQLFHIIVVHIQIIKFQSTHYIVYTTCVCVYTKSILTSYKAENGVMQTKKVTQICCELTTLVVTVHPLGAVASCQNFCLKFLTKHTVGSILLPSSSLMILRIMSHGLYSICASLIKHSEAVRCHTRWSLVPWAPGDRACPILLSRYILYIVAIVIHKLSHVFSSYLVIWKTERPAQGASFAFDHFFNNFTNHHIRYRSITTNYRWFNFLQWPTYFRN